MGNLVQRKRFDHPQLAAEQAAEFSSPTWKIPGVSLSARAVSVGEEHWVYVTQEGDFVTGDEPLLPDYEKVD